MILLPYFSEEMKLTMKSGVGGYESEMLSFCLMNVLSPNICQIYSLLFVAVLVFCRSEGDANSCFRRQFNEWFP